MTPSEATGEGGGRYEHIDGIADVRQPTLVPLGSLQADAEEHEKRWLEKGY